MKKIMVLLFAVVFVFVGCSQASKEDGAVVEQVSNLTPVEVKKPIVGGIANDTILVGKLEANDVAYVSPKVQGLEDIETVHVEVGDKVLEGDILVVLDSENTADQIEASRLAYVTAKKNYDALAESIRSAQANLDRTQKLFDQGLVSAQQLEAAELQASDGQLKTVQSQMSQSFFAYENAKKALDNTVLIAPIQGVVTSLDFKENNFATSQSMLVITDMSSLKINLNVTENIINKITEDNKVLVEISSARQGLIESEIEYINPVADTRTGLYNVVIKMDNTKGLFKPGMFARVYVTLESNDFASLLPVDAVLSDDEGTFVYVAEDTTVVKKYVVLGIDNGESVEILSGLLSEDQVIVKGQNFINEGSEIRVVVGGN